jgi:hypothetical protein
MGSDDVLALLTLSSLAFLIAIGVAGGGQLSRNGLLAACLWCVVACVATFVPRAVAAIVSQPIVPSMLILAVGSMVVAQMRRGWWQLGAMVSGVFFAYIVASVSVSLVFEPGAATWSSRASPTTDMVVSCFSVGFAPPSRVLSPNSG